MCYGSNVLHGSNILLTSTSLSLSLSPFSLSFLSIFFLGGGSWGVWGGGKLPPTPTPPPLDETLHLANDFSVAPMDMKWWKFLFLDNYTWQDNFLSSAFVKKDKLSSFCILLIFWPDALVRWSWEGVEHLVKTLTRSVKSSSGRRPSL